jgi:hypothetical protein
MDAIDEKHKVPASTTQIELRIAQEVSAELGEKLDRIDRGAERRLDEAEYRCTGTRSSRPCSATSSSASPGRPPSTISRRSGSSPTT